MTRIWKIDVKPTSKPWELLASLYNEDIAMFVFNRLVETSTIGERLRVVTPEGDTWEVPVQ